MSETPVKSNSLKTLGYTIEPVSDVKDEKGNDFIFKVTPPSFYMKQTKKGKLRAFKSVNSKADTTIEGLYNFEITEGDIVGSRPTVTAKEEVAA